VIVSEYCSCDYEDKGRGIERGRTTIGLANCDAILSLKPINHSVLTHYLACFKNNQRLYRTLTKLYSKNLNFRKHFRLRRKQVQPEAAFKSFFIRKALVSKKSGRIPGTVATFGKWGDFVCKSCAAQIFTKQSLILPVYAHFV